MPRDSQNKKCTALIQKKKSCILQRLQLGLRRDIHFGVLEYPTNIHALSYILLSSFSTRATGVTVALLWTLFPTTIHHLFCLFFLTFAETSNVTSFALKRLIQSFIHPSLNFYYIRYGTRRFTCGHRSWSSKGTS